MINAQCIQCGSSEIPSERLEALLDLDLPITCFSCSTVEAPLVLMSYEHKTGGTPMVVPNKADGTRDPELVRKALRCFKRQR